MRNTEVVVGLNDYGVYDQMILNKISTNLMWAEDAILFLALIQKLCCEISWVNMLALLLILDRATHQLLIKEINTRDPLCAKSVRKSCIH